VSFEEFVFAIESLWLQGEAKTPQIIIDLIIIITAQQLSLFRRFLMLRK